MTSSLIAWFLRSQDPVGLSAGAGKELPAKECTERDDLTFTRNNLINITQTNSVTAKSKIIILVGVIQTFWNTYEVTKQ